MKPSYGSAFGIGALLGLVLSTCALLFVGATGGIPKLGVTGEGASIEPVFSVPASALWIVVILTGAACGLILAITTKAISRVIDPDTDGASLWLIGPIGAVVGGFVAFAVFPLGITVVGEVKDGLATATVAQFTMLASIAGLAGGAMVAWVAYILSRPPAPKEDTELFNPAAAQEAS